MRRFPVIAVAATVAGAGLLYADQEPKFRAGTHSVSVYATVIDQGGRLVPDLTREDFEVFDNGTRQTLTLFENDVRPITVVMMLDRSGSMLGSFDLVRDAAAQFVMNLLPMDKARIGSFSNRIQVDPPAFTSEPNELLRILHEELQEAGPTPLWNATSVAMTALAHEAGRRVVLIFTDGKDSESRPGSGASFAEVRARARAEEIMVYAIGLGSGCAPLADLGPGQDQIRFQGRGRGGSGRGGRLPGGRIPGGRIPGGPIGGRPGLPIPGFPGRGGRIPGDPGDRLPGRGGPIGRPTGPTDDAFSPCNPKPDPDLRQLADDGGGGYFELHGTDDLASTFARVAEELHHQYLLAFTPAVLDGKSHTIDVRVREPNFRPRARRSYVATADK